MLQVVLKAQKARAAASAQKSTQAFRVEQGAKPGPSKSPDAGLTSGLYSEK
jgi:hypothetical protein